jgi:hypothetical protein
LKNRLIRATSSSPRLDFNELPESPQQFRETFHLEQQRASTTVHPLAPRLSVAPLGALQVTSFDIHVDTLSHHTAFDNTLLQMCWRWLNSKHSQTRNPPWTNTMPAQTCHPGAYECNAVKHSSVMVQLCYSKGVPVGCFLLQSKCMNVQICSTPACCVSAC